MKKIITILVFSTLLISIASAEVGDTVSHSHEGRVHTHPLPSIGINHNHNKNTNKPNLKKSLKWIILASSTDEKNTKRKYYGKYGSLRVNNNRASIIGKLEENLTNTISLYKWSVPVSHCDNEMGVVKWENIDGSYYGKSEFVFDSGNVSSAVAKRICNAIN